MTHEDILAIIKLGPILLFLIIFLYGLIVGMIKGNRKVIRRLIYVAIYVTGITIALPYITRAVMTVEVNGFTVDQYVTDLVTTNEAINNVFSKIPGLLNLVLEFPAAIVSMVLFMVLIIVGLPLSFPIYWIYMAIYALISKLIFRYTRFEKDENGEFIRNHKGKKIKKKKHHRVVAGVIKGVQYVLVSSIVLTPLGFVTRIYKVGKETTESKSLANITYFESFDEYLAYIDAYNGSFIGFASDNPLNEAISNYLMQIEVEGDKTTVEAEVTKVVKAAVYIEESGIIKTLSSGGNVQNLDLSTINVDKLDLAIECLFESKILDSLVADGVNYVMETYLSEKLVTLTGDTDIVNKLKYSSSSEVKQELLAVTSLLKTIINAKLLDAYNSANGDVIGMVNDVSTDDVETILNKVLSIQILSKAMPGVLNGLLDDYGLVETLTQQNNNDFVKVIVDAVNLVKALEIESMSTIMEGNMVDNIVNTLYKNGTISDKSIDALASLLARVTSNNAFDDIIVLQLNNLLTNFGINLNARMITNVNTKDDWKIELSVLESICKLYKDYTVSNKVDFLVVNELMDDLKDTKAMILAFPIAYKTLFPMLNIEIDASKIVYIDYSKEDADEEEAKFYAYWKEQLVGLEDISNQFVELNIDSMDDVSLDLLKVEANKEPIANILATAFGMDLLKDGVVKYLDTMIGDMLSQYEVSVGDGAIAYVNSLVDIYPHYVVVDEVEYNVDTENKYYIDGVEHVVSNEELFDNTLNRVWYNEVDNLGVMVDTLTSSPNFTEASTLTKILNAVDEMALLKDAKVDLLVYAVNQAGVLDVGEIDKSIIDFTKEKEILINIVEKQETINSLSGIEFNKLTATQQEDIGYVLDNLLKSDIFANKVSETLASAITSAGISHDNEIDTTNHTTLKETIKNVTDWEEELGVIKTLTSIKSSDSVDYLLFETIEDSELFGECKYNIMIMMVTSINDVGGNITLSVPSVDALTEINIEYGTTQYEVEKQIFVKASSLQEINMETLTTNDTLEIAEVLTLMADSKIFTSQYDSLVNDIKSGLSNPDYGISENDSVDTKSWSKAEWKSELDKLVTIKDGMKNIPENAEDLDADVVGGVLDIIDSSKFIAAGSAKNAADTIVNKLMGGNNDLSKDGSWVNTLKKLFN